MGWKTVSLVCCIGSALGFAWWGVCDFGTKSREVKQRRSRLVPGWVTAVLDFVEDPVSRYTTYTQLLQYQDRTLSGPEEVASGFASHFESLATPTDDPGFDSSYHTQVTLDKLLIEDICARQEPAYHPTTPAEIARKQRLQRTPLPLMLHWLWLKPRMRLRLNRQNLYLLMPAKPLTLAGFPFAEDLHGRYWWLHVADVIELI